MSNHLASRLRHVLKLVPAPLDARVHRGCGRDYRGMIQPVDIQRFRSNQLKAKDFHWLEGGFDDQLIYQRESLAAHIAHIIPHKHT